MIARCPTLALSLGLGEDGEVVEDLIERPRTSRSSTPRCQNGAMSAVLCYSYIRMSFRGSSQKKNVKLYVPHLGCHAQQKTPERDPMARGLQPRTREHARVRVHWCGHGARGESANASASDLAVVVALVPRGQEGTIVGHGRAWA
jgi:hypothetical protein